MHHDSDPSDEQSIAEVDTFLGSTRADTARARRIERSMPISFAAPLVIVRCGVHAKPNGSTIVAGLLPA